MARKPVGDSQVANRSRILGVLVFYSGVIGTGGMRIFGQTFGLERSYLYNLLNHYSSQVAEMTESSNSE